VQITPTKLGAVALPAALTLTGLGIPQGAAAAQAPQTPTPAQPNVLFVLADDLGWSDLGGPRTNLGNPNGFNETPAIDRLAEEGMAFPNAYACINCAPTRAALLTGLYAPRSANNIYAVDDLNRGGDHTMLVGPPQARPDGDVSLPDEAVTVAETLQDAGYATGYVGKFHITRTGAAVTESHGFDENLGGTHAGAPAFYHARDGAFAHPSIGPALDQYAADYTQQYVDDNIKPYTHGVSETAVDALVGTDKHVTDALADATIDFVDRHDDEPFFTWMSEYAVHSPVGDAQARADLLAKYRAKAPGPGPSKPSYAALAEGLDQSVARVIDHLETTPDPRNPGHSLADNTLVILTSDNGGRTDLGAFNGPLKGQKGELDEGGVRVPFIAWSGNPQLVDGGRINTSRINGTDLYPTLTALAGIDLPDGVPFDGKSLRGAFADGDRLDPPRFAHLPGYLIAGGRDQRPQSVIWSDRWKLVYAYETQGWELYDLTDDIGERTNLASDRPALVQDLGTRLIHWLDSVDAPLATLREGRDPLQLSVTGTTYADDRSAHRQGETITIEPGGEVPLVLTDN
jgi:arylsulfatase A-like enzyme